MPDVFSRRSKLGLRAYGLIKFLAHKPEWAYVFSWIGAVAPSNEWDNFQAQPGECRMCLVGAAN